MHIPGYDAWKLASPPEGPECSDDCIDAQDDSPDELTRDGHLPSCPADPDFEPIIPCRCGDVCRC